MDNVHWTWNKALILTKVSLFVLGPSPPPREQIQRYLPNQLSQPPASLIRSQLLRLVSEEKFFRLLWRLPPLAAGSQSLPVEVEDAGRYLLGRN